mmetsp:Transcript_16412/g.38920  ORF Transcript_16412/g.38920 Transcript_16412/m.38920 type:complete len:742 (+) Transcript_16412:22-2247(+)
MASDDAQVASSSISNSAAGQAFHFCGYIDEIDRRAISLEQMQRLAAVAASSCCTWSTGDHSKLSMNVLNFMHLHDFLILPATEEWDCSVVELMTNKPQDALVFVSHWWGELLLDFTECVSSYYRAKDMKEDSFAWICAFAERHHSAQQRLSEDLEASFLPALTRSGHVLLVCRQVEGDEQQRGPRSFFSRAWCLLEASKAIEQKKTLDFAVRTHAGPQVLVENFLDQVGQMEKKSPRSASRSKLLRKSAFPVEVLAAGLQLDIEVAQTFNEADHDRILNCIAGHPPGYVLEPGDARVFHEEFRKFNCKLRAELALAMWFQAVQQGRMDPQFSNTSGVSRVSSVLGADLAHALLGDESRTSLTKNFSHCSRFDDGSMAMLAAALPIQLRHLELSFWMCGMLGSPGLRALCKTFPQMKLLETLTLDFQICNRIGQTGIDALGLCLPATIVSLRLNFERTNIRSVLGLAEGIASLKNLRVLSLDFGGIDNVDDRQVSGISECLPQRLINFHLALRGCPHFTTNGVHSLVLGLSPELSMLSLNFSSCDRINNDSVKWLAHKLPRMLKVLRVDLSDTQVDDSAAMLLMQRLPSTLQGARISVANTRVSTAIQRACRKLETIRSMLVEGAMRSQPMEKTTRRIRRKSPLKRSGTQAIDTSEFNFASHTCSSKAHFAQSLSSFGDASVGPSIRFLLSLTNKTGKGPLASELHASTRSSAWGSEGGARLQQTLPRCRTSPAPLTSGPGL